jgi:hypothetical protein
VIWVLIIIAAVAIVGVWFVITRQSHQETGVESFRRHIDALSPEARREVMDRVRPQENGNGRPNPNGNPNINPNGYPSVNPTGTGTPAEDDPDEPEH